MFSGSKRNFLIFGGAGLALALLLALMAYRRGGSEWVKPRSGPLVEAVYGVGTVTAWNTFNLKLSVPEVVKRLDVLEGQEVAKGATLLAFSDGLTYRAPFPGTVTAINYKVAETVPPQMTVLTVTDLEHRYILVSLEQSGALRVRKGQRARLTFEDIHMQALDGEVVSVYPRGDQFMVRIDVPSFPEGVLVGMVADVAIQVAERKEVLQVPEGALKAGQLTLRRGGKTLKLAVKIGASDGQWAEVLEDKVKPDDEVHVPTASGR